MRWRFWRSADPEPAKEGELTAEGLSPLLRSILLGQKLTPEKAMNVPAYAASVEMIAGIVSYLPIRLYRREGDDVDEVADDRRVMLLNGDTGDLLRGPEMMKRFVIDYYTDKGAYIFVNRIGNEVESIHYVDPGAVSLLFDETDHIFKTARFSVDGRQFFPWQFIFASRNARNGIRGTSMIDQSGDAVSTAYYAMLCENRLMRRGGNKRGYLKAPKKISEGVLEKLKQAFNRMYSEDSENVIALNEGIEFQEASETSVEMQMAENKRANADDIMGLFLVPPTLIRGGADEDDHKNFVRYCLMPLLSIISSAINSAMLLEDEKPSMYFEFDLKEFTKASMRERWQAWATAKKNGMVNADEFRRFENLPPLGMDYINLGLNDVLMDPVTKEIIVPNMSTIMDTVNSTITQTDSQPRPSAGGGDKDGDSSNG